MRFAKFHEMETDRLVLRKLQLGDVYEYYERLFGDGDVSRDMLFDPHQSIMESLESVQRKLARYEEENYYYRAKRIDNNEEIAGCLLVMDGEEYRIATSCLADNSDPNLFTVCAYEVDPDTIEVIE